MSSSRLVGYSLLRRTLLWPSKSNQQQLTASRLWSSRSTRIAGGGSISSRAIDSTVGASILATSVDMPPRRQIPTLVHHAHQRVRLRHSSRKGNHLEVLDDMAHSQEREKAEERRKKKKEKKVAKKERKGKHYDADESASSGSVQHDDDDDDQDQGGDDDDDENAEAELPNPKKIKDRMLSIVRRFEDSLKSIRGAEPTPELFEDVLVNAYDSETTPLKAVAQVVIVSPTLANVTCFDPTLLKHVREAIQLQLNLNPQEDGAEGDGVLRVPLPKVSLERRQETATQLGKKAENYRQRIRRVRRRYNGIIKQGKDGKLEHISKDDVFRVAKEIDTVTENAIEKLNKITEKKHDSIMNMQ